MKWIRYWTQDEYDKVKIPFREIQRQKPRYNYHWETWDDGHRYERATPRKMTNKWNKLQKEFNLWNRSKYDPKTIYFIIDKN